MMSVLYCVSIFISYFVWMENEWIIRNLCNDCTCLHVFLNQSENHVVRVTLAWILYCCRILDIAVFLYYFCINNFFIFNFLTFTCSFSHFFLIFFIIILFSYFLISSVSHIFIFISHFKTFFSFLLFSLFLRFLTF